jgi:hypothetical protein
MIVSLFGANAAFAQSNDDDYTPLNSRIKRDRQFPTDVRDRWRTQVGAVERERRNTMVGQFSRCLYNRSNERSLELLQTTDFGFANFGQIGVAEDRVARVYGFQDCLGRVASNNGTSVQMYLTPGALRSWLLQEAYFDRNKDGPAWVQPGFDAAPRVYPLSAERPEVKMAMEFADCVVATDPFTADYFFRTAAGSAQERAAVEQLSPALGPCLPEGAEVELQLPDLRLWLGEALWHASMNRVAVPAEAVAAGSEG